VLASLTSHSWSRTAFVSRADAPEPGDAWIPVVSVYIYVYCNGASLRIRIPNIVSILHTAYVYGYKPNMLRRRRKCIRNAFCVIVGHHDHFT
jgi:hypothetical protein